jgi:putative PIN family toxin of toxin-antitoxin system
MSAIFFSGPPSAILKAWRDGTVQLCLSPEIIDEYLRVAGTLAQEFPGIEIGRLLSVLVAQSEIIQAPPLQRQVCTDPDDDKFLACALTSDSRIVISGDKALLRASGHLGITVLTPRAFLERYIKNKD